MQSKVLKYFYEILKIPRPSFHEEKMVDFLVNYAKEKKLEYYLDSYKNVLIKKQTKQCEPLILQAHTDMVCVGDRGIDFLSYQIEPVVCDGFLSAKRSSLGADNGVGVAMILSILDENFPMNIEALFTANEETTMSGTKNFDLTKLISNNFISLDGTEESVIEIASASSSDCAFFLGNLEKIEVAKNMFKVEISGLRGGHSGVDINKNRSNAIILLIKLLKQIKDVKIIEINAKSKANEIPTKASCCFETSMLKQNLDEIVEKFFTFYVNLIDAPKFKIELSRFQGREEKQKAIQSTQKILDFLDELPTEKIKEDINGNVSLSANLYEIDLNNSKVFLSFRSNDKTNEKLYKADILNLTKLYNVKFKIVNYLPYLKEKKNSKLRNIMIKAHKQIFNEKPSIKKIHAGLEGGIFLNRNPKFDINVIGASIYDLHSTQERVNIESIDKTYNWLKEIVKNQ